MRMNSLRIPSRCSSRMMEGWSLTLLLLMVMMIIPTSQGLPDGFVSEIVSPNTKGVMAVFAPNLRLENKRPMMIVIAKKGTVHVLENPDYEGNSTQILDLSLEVCTNGERGLTSIAIHPNFLETQWVYLYYNRWSEGCREDPEKGPQNILVRYTMNATSLRLENEQILLETGIQGEKVHNGGGMMFGTDGYLYLATGDGGNRNSVQDRRNLHGSLLRLKDDGSVPESNPYAANGVACGKSNGVVPKDQGENIFCSEIFAWGFRNPIRMALHEEQSNNDKVLFSISDVGAQQFEELSWAGTDYKGKNYGWPMLEGPCVPNSIDNCPLPSEDSNLVDPYHYYVHTSYENGGCVVGSTFVPKGIWPEEFQYLFIDFIFLKIYNLFENPSEECRDTCSPPISGFSNSTFYESIQEEDENINEARMIDLFFGPYRDTQALYVIKYGNRNSILRIRYVGMPPVAIIKIENQNPAGVSRLPTSGVTKDNPTDNSPPPIFSVGDAIVFDGSRSFDPEGKELLFEWDFGVGGDSSPSTAMRQSYTYDMPGEYVVTLTVTDSEYQTDVVSTTILVDIPPTVAMVYPQEGKVFRVGEVLRLEANAQDNQGKRIADNNLIWEVRLHRSLNEYDIFLKGRKGNRLNLPPAPGPDNLEAVTTSFLSVILYATDEKGLKTKVVRNIQPDVVRIGLVTRPEGLRMVVDNSDLVAPVQIQSWVDYDLPIQIVSEQPPYKFKRWSDGEEASNRTFSIPSYAERNTLTAPKPNSVATSITAIFCLDRDAPCSEAVSCCSGHCNLNGMCQEFPSQSIIRQSETPTESPSLSTQDSDGSNLVSQTKETNNDSEPDQKPVLPDSVADNFDIDRVNTNSLDQSNQEKASYGIGPTMTAVLVTFIILLLLAPCYFGWKYFQLKRKFDADSNDHYKEKPEDPAMTPRTMIVTPNDKVDHTESNLDDTDAHVDANTSNISVLSTGTIWDRIAEETERRARLRAKYSSLSGPMVPIPGTPQTAEAKDSPSTLDSAPSPSSVLTNNIDETLVRLDDLLAKTFSRKLTRSNRKQKQNSSSSQMIGGNLKDEKEVFNYESDVEAPSEQSYLASLWMSSANETMPGSPLRDDRKVNHGTDTNMSLASAYSTDSLRLDSNVSRMRLPEISDTSLLLFQDNDLSMSIHEVANHKNNGFDKKEETAVKRGQDSANP